MAGNHFNEWAGFDCEWELYPSKQAQEDWITAYVSGLKEWRGREVPPSEVSGLMKEVELLQQALMEHQGTYTQAVQALSARGGDGGQPNCGVVVLMDSEEARSWPRQLLATLRGVSLAADEPQLSEC